MAGPKAAVMHVDIRETRHYEYGLGLQCDDTEMPYPADGSGADAHFFAGGKIESAEGSQKGMTALCIFGDAVGVILAPLDVGLPAVWATAALPEVSVRTEGRTGITGRRPASITLQSEAFRLELWEVVQFYPGKQLMQARREGALLSALRTPAVTTPQGASSPASPLSPAQSHIAAIADAAWASRQLNPARWLPDPLQRHEYRYWDGTAWSAQVCDQGKVSLDPWTA